MKREELKEQNRTQIIEAAKRLFLAQGIQKTSVRQISQESGISYVTMYKYFADKEALVQEVLTGLIDTSFADAQATIKNSSQPFFATSAGDSQHLLARRHHQSGFLRRAF